MSEGIKNFMSARRPAHVESSALTRLQRFGLFFFDHAKTTLFIWVVLAIFGVLSYTTLLKREGFPAVEPSLATVQGTYFVNDSGRVDREVAKPLSDFIKRQAGVKSVSTTSGNNFYILQVEFHDGTDAAAASKQLDDASKAAKTLPATATAEFKPIAFSIDPEGQGDNLLIALFSKEGTDTAALYAKTQEAVAFLQNDQTLKDSVERVRAVELYRTGVNPATGQSVTEQKTFDRIGLRDDEFRFYQSGVIALKARSGVDELHLFDRTQAALARLERHAAFEEYDAVIAANYAEDIRAQIGSLQENLLGGLAAVIVISFLLISLRASIVTALSMATVLAITLIGLYIAGYSLNTVTLFSLVLCLGLIVDDTTIMVEAIDAGRNSRKPRRQIAADAIKRVARASTAGTVTTMLGFAPMLFIGGFLGDVIQAIPVTIIISLAVSLLVSLSVVPFMTRILVRKHDGKKPSFSPLHTAEWYISQKLAVAIRVGKRSRPKLTVLGVTAIILSLALTAAGGALFSRLKFNIFPATKDSDNLVLTLRFPENTTIQTAQQVTDEVNAITAQELGPYIKQASLYGTGSDSQATVTVDLVSYKEREITSPELVSQLKQEFAQYQKAEVMVMQGDVGPPPGVFAARVFYEGNRDQATRLARDIRAYLDGREFKRPDGSTFAVEQARVTPEQATLRDEGQTYVEVQATFDASDTTALVTIAQNGVTEAFPQSRVARYGLTEDALRFDFGSESENQESFKAMLIAFPILLVVMYVLLALQFRSLLQPVLIFVALPFSIFGIAAGLYLTNNPFSFFTLIGVFALIGISVNNTILLTDFANQAREAGEGRIDAIATAIQARFRPLITTSLTSVVALVPLALSDPFWESLAVTLIFGLLSSTFLVVVAFPYYYLGAEYLRIRFTRLGVLLWLAALIGGSIVLVALDGNYYLPMWWLVCVLVRPVHLAHQRLWTRR